MQNSEFRIKKSEIRPAAAEAIAGKNQRSEIGDRIVRFFQFNIRHASFVVFRPSFCISASRLGEAFRLRGTAKHRFGAATAGGAWVAARHSTASARRRPHPACNATRSIAGRSAFRISSRTGQALIEFTVALVVIMALVTATLLLNKIEWAHTSTMTQARAAAGDLALDLIYRGPIDAKFISDWLPGADNVRYTDDDEPELDTTAVTLIDDIVADTELYETGVLPTNTFTRLALSPTPIGEFYLVKGSESMTIDLSGIPAFGQLFYGGPNISVKSDAWLTWTEGIY